MKQLIILLSLTLAFLFSSAGGNQSSESLRSVQQKKTGTLAPQKDVYTCPVHSEVVKDKPGKCPKCGRDLVKKEANKVVYTCPHHPEVKQDKPGVCPKCGMDLVKKEDTKKKVSKKP